MAIRFRKSIKLAPGIRMNLSGSGASWSFGGRGASVNIGKRGTFLNTGMPGTGLSLRQKLSSESSGRTGASYQPTPVEKVKVTLTVLVGDDGSVTFTDAAGKPVSEYLIETAKRQQGAAIHNLIQQSCDKLNSEVEAVAELHLDTPSPSASIEFKQRQYAVVKPAEPVLLQLGFFARLFKSKVQKVQRQNERALDIHEEVCNQWIKDKAVFDSAESARLKLLADAQAGYPASMEAFFGFVLQDIGWPKETNVSFEVLDAGKLLAFDVDLPELQDMPNKTATVPQRGYRLSVKEMGPIKVQKLYAKHVHSIAFRLLGEAFAMLPSVQEVLLSGYTQRPDPTTGRTQDDYLFSVRVARHKWERLDFDHLSAIDVVEALAQFELRRTMTKSGAFKPIEPLAPLQTPLPITEAIFTTPFPITILSPSGSSRSL